jgi:hypothetical protein
LKRHALRLLGAAIVVAQLPLYGLNLPSKVDNSRSKYFPPIMRQIQNSCGQASGIYYTFTYEVNLMRNRPANSNKNIFPTHFTYNFLNSGKDMGTLDEAGWRAAMAVGVPSIEDYGAIYYKDTTHWMSGYEKYFRALQNKVKAYHFVKVKTKDDIYNIKHWLYNHHTDKQIPGGLATFRAGVRKASIKKIPSGQYQSGKHIYTRFKSKGGHFMTIAGYDDKIGYDFNGDGKITNNKDITGDGKVDIRDHERGAFLIVNSRGPNWCDNGRIYVPYRLFALPVSDGGIYFARAEMVKVMKYCPQATVRLKFSFNNRKKLLLQIGVRVRNEKGWEQYSIEPRMFSQFWGSGEFPMRGKNNKSPIEICLDATSMLKHMQQKRAQFFIKLAPADGTKATGKLLEADLLFHPRFAKPKIHQLHKGNTEIGEKGVTVMLKKIEVPKFI